MKCVVMLAVVEEPGTIMVLAVVDSVVAAVFTPVKFVVMLVIVEEPGTVMVLAVVDSVVAAVFTSVKFLVMLAVVERSDTVILILEKYVVIEVGIVEFIVVVM